jgi:hypothetical protein
LQNRTSNNFDYINTLKKVLFDTIFTTFQTAKFTFKTLGQKFCYEQNSLTAAVANYEKIIGLKSHQNMIAKPDFKQF